VANSGTKIQLERFRRSLIECGHGRAFRSRCCVWNMSSR
jgi:hypothetical protein